MAAANRKGLADGTRAAGIGPPDGNQTLREVLGIQLAVTLGAALVAWPWSGNVALAVLLGGGACVGASAYSARRLFAAPVDSPGKVMSSLYRAEVAKLVVAVGLLAVVMVAVEDINVIALCLAYVAVQTGGNVLAALRLPPVGRDDATGKELTSGPRHG